jgi:hypothetical protein
MHENAKYEYALHEYAKFLITGLAKGKSINPARTFFCIKFVFTIPFTKKCTLSI